MWNRGRGLKKEPCNLHCFPLGPIISFRQINKAQEPDRDCSSSPIHGNIELSKLLFIKKHIQCGPKWLTALIKICNNDFIKINNSKTIVCSTKIGTWYYFILIQLVRERDSVDHVFKIEKALAHLSYLYSRFMVIVEWDEKE